MSLLMFAFLAIPYTIRGMKTITSQVGSDTNINWNVDNKTEEVINIEHKQKVIISLWAKENYFDPILEYRDRVHFSFVKEDRDVKLILCLKNVSKLDEGLYTSYTQINRKKIESVKLIVTGPLEEPAIKYISRHQQDIIYNKVELVCQLSKDTNGSALWWINDTLVASNKKHVIFKNTITIANVEESDQYDKFSCAGDVNSVRSKSYRIRIEGPDNTTLTAKEGIIYEFSTLNIKCMATCYISCSFNWIKHGDRVIPDTLTSDSAGIRVAKNVTRKDAGNYSCMAKNIITNKTVVDNFTLKVIYGPDDVYFNEVNKKTRPSLAQLTTVNCSADCYPPCVYSLNGPGVDIVNSKETWHTVKEKETYTCSAINPTSGKVSRTSLLILSHKYDHSAVQNDSKNTSVSVDETTPVSGIISMPVVTKILLGTSVALTCLICGVIICKLRKRCFKPSSNESTAEEVAPPDTQTGMFRENEFMHVDIDPSANYWTIREDNTGGLQTVIDLTIASASSSLGWRSCPINPIGSFENIPDEDAYLQPI